MATVFIYSICKSIRIYRIML